MTETMESPTAALLILSDGTRWKGFLAGAPGTVRGEICFNTGMTGYQEIFSDPSYSGQVVVMTNPHIGNYGIHPGEFESKQVHIAGMVCHQFSFDYSRFDAEAGLHETLFKQGITAIYGLDTRALVRHLRNKGSMNCVISSETEDIQNLMTVLNACPDMSGLELSSKVCTPVAYHWNELETGFKVAAYDYGIKFNILRNLEARGCRIRIFPAQAPVSELLAYEPDGFFLSNGPGDPAAMDYAVENIRELMALDKPIFGICLGHQLIARAAGIPTYKMFNGHHGINHPVKNLITGRSEITSQNHGFAVDKQALDNHPEIELTHIHLNDDSVAGMRFKHKPIFSVQYHPEAGPGPHDSRYLFDDFIQMMQIVIA